MGVVLPLPRQPAVAFEGTALVCIERLSLLLQRVRKDALHGRLNRHDPCIVFLTLLVGDLVDSLIEFIDRDVAGLIEPGFPLENRCITLSREDLSVTASGDIRCATFFVDTLSIGTTGTSNDNILLLLTG